MPVQHRRGLVKAVHAAKVCVAASHHGGHRHKPRSIEELCRLWSDGHLASLWRYASGHARRPTQSYQSEVAEGI